METSGSEKTSANTRGAYSFHFQCKGMKADQLLHSDIKIPTVIILGLSHFRLNMLSKIYSIWSFWLFFFFNCGLGHVESAVHFRVNGSAMDNT